MRHAMPLLFILASATGAAQAEPLEALTGDGRYQLMEINDKIVRLDTRSGRFELCRMENEDWTCLVAQDDRQRLEDTVAALTKRVAALEAARRKDEAGRQEAVAPMARSSGPLAAPVSMTQPKVAEAAPAAVTAVPPMPAASMQAASTASRSIAGGPVPAAPVPTASAGSLDPDAGMPAATGQPFDISPGATVAAAEERPGLVDRLTGLLPSIGW